MEVNTRQSIRYELVLDNFEVRQLLTLLRNSYHRDTHVSNRFLAEKIMQGLGQAMDSAADISP